MQLIRVHIGCFQISIRPQDQASENLQSQILLVSQIQLTIIHDASDFASIRINRLDNSIASDLISFRELVATFIFSAQVDPEHDNNDRRKDCSDLKSYKLSVPHVYLPKQRLTTSKIIQVGLYRGLNHC